MAATSVARGAERGAVEEDPEVSTTGVAVESNAKNAAKNIARSVGRSASRTADRITDKIMDRTAEEVRASTRELAASPLRRAAPLWLPSN